ncbi:MAG: IclR family transcriptional regulator [Thermaerobacter sp.]|nr:IclR family transcriptional regulator [Thermaerobacter sp.]
MGQPRVSQTDGEGRNRSHTLRHALSILETLSACGYANGASLNQLAQATGLNKSTVLRLLTPLAERRIVAKDATSGTYRLGLQVVEWAEAVLDGTEIVRVGSPHLHELVEKTGETAFLVVYDDGDVVYLSKVESPNAIRMSSQIGTRTPAHTTSNGKAMLAFLPPQETERIIARGLRPFAPNTITSPEVLRSQLADIRRRHFALDDQENVPDARCVGAAVFNRQGRVAGGISLASPAYRMELDKLVELGPLVVETADAISRELGFVRLGDSPGHQRPRA